MYKIYDDWSNLAKKAYDSDLESGNFKNIDHIVFAGMGGYGTIGDLSESILSKTNIHGVLIDGEEANDVTFHGNAVTVLFLAGAETIEIIGTFVVPEFGTIAMMILLVSIVSIITISAKSRLGIIPRY